MNSETLRAVLATGMLSGALTVGLVLGGRIVLAGPSQPTAEVQIATSEAAFSDRRVSIRTDPPPTVDNTASLPESPGSDDDLPADPGPQSAPPEPSGTGDTSATARVSEVDSPAARTEERASPAPPQPTIMALGIRTPRPTELAPAPSERPAPSPPSPAPTVRTRPAPSGETAPEPRNSAKLHSGKGHKPAGLANAERKAHGERDRTDPAATESEPSSRRDKKVGPATEGLKKTHGARHSKADARRSRDDTSAGHGPPKKAPPENAPPENAPPENAPPKKARQGKGPAPHGKK